MPSKPKPAPPLDPDRPKLANLILSCSTCKMTCSFRGYSDPNHKDGWPLHRCQGVFRGERRKFDQCEPDRFRTSGFGAL